MISFYPCSLSGMPAVWSWISLSFPSLCLFALLPERFPQLYLTALLVGFKYLLSCFYFLKALFGGSLNILKCILVLFCRYSIFSEILMIVQKSLEVFIFCLLSASLISPHPICLFLCYMLLLILDFLKYLVIFGCLLVIKRTSESSFEALCCPSWLSL